MPDYALTIRNGTLIDGTGAPGVAGDLAVQDGRLARIGRIEGSAAREIDASGMAVTPGFIDVHAHDDVAVLSSPIDFKLRQGVTTDIVGNCGAGVAPTEPGSGPSIPGADLVLGPLPEPTWRTFGEYMDAVAAARPALNVGCLVPHGAVRVHCMGLDSRPPDERELAAMREDVAEGLAAGALGMSTGLIYPPGTFARTEEIIELNKVVGEHGGIYVSHIRDEAYRLLEAVEEAVRIGREGGTPVQISHHKASGKSNLGKTVESIAYIEAQRAAGLDVTFDVYPYTAASTVFAVMRRAPEALDPNDILIASCQRKHEYEGKTIAQIAEMLDLSADDAMDRVLAEEPGATAVFFIMDETDVQRVLSHPQCMIGSDGLPSPTGKPHPRLYGTFARVLGTYACKKRLLTLEDAVRKMTSLPARRLQLAERGELREGWWADVVVFNPQTVEDMATYQEPRQYPMGIDYVIVNGQVAVEPGEQTAARAGRLLRRGRV